MSSAIYFSKFLVTNQVFFKTKFTYALVNLKPIVPGHVLVVPLRTNVIELTDLTLEESQDYFQVLQLIQRFIKWYYKADALNIAIQDGPEAGQSVPHLHTHIIPRYKLNNYGDKVYDKIENWALDEWETRRKFYIEIGGREGRKALAKPDAQRIARDDSVMAEEASSLVAELQNYLKVNPEDKQWLGNNSKKI